tara:strand:+ start:265 stop:585 length:321 start_codon:yes stop_codon:yes gene_type:complete
MGINRFLVKVLTPCLLLMSSVVLAAETGNTLRGYAYSNDSYEQGYYQGYVVAVIESNVLKVCPPKNATLGQAALIVKKYMDDHPEELNLWADEFILKAITSVWACR